MDLAPNSQVRPVSMHCPARSTGPPSRAPVRIKRRLDQQHGPVAARARGTSRRPSFALARHPVKGTIPPPFPPPKGAVQAICTTMIVSPIQAFTKDIESSTHSTRFINGE
ncbi:hypothetical protein GCM10010331_18960 [Streptomyces xanthochromogenes]|nr:hypothetical protein GCM10010331_18960 [Streptomyces xanthochromogenes]